MPPDPWQIRLLRSQGRTDASSLLAPERQEHGDGRDGAARGPFPPEVPRPSPEPVPPPVAGAVPEGHRLQEQARRADRRSPRSPRSASSFKNGSRIVALPGTEETVRGFSGVRLLVVDEAARVDDPLYFSIRPMLAVSGGRMVCLTTPFGKRGFFYEEWTGDGPWDRIKVTARECPRISEKFLEEERASRGVVVPAGILLFVRGKRGRGLRLRGYRNSVGREHHAADLKNHYLGRCGDDVRSWARSRAGI